MRSPGDQRRRRTAAFRPRNYRALVGIVTTFTQPVDALRRYLGRDAEYPWRAILRTPLGPVDVLVPTSHDVRTVNEVFCRQDYGRSRPQVVVDVGANIGVAALYWLTRRPDSVVHCWEPDPRNLETLRANLAPFADRARIHDHALAPTAGSATFATEPVGRYGGLTDYLTVTSHDVITVQCDAIGDALTRVAAEHGQIDLVKIDTEGSEEALVSAIPDSLRGSIGELVYELPGRIVHS